MGTPDEGFAVGAMYLHDTWDGKMTEDECAWPIAQKHCGNMGKGAWWPRLPSLSEVQAMTAPSYVSRRQAGRVRRLSGKGEVASRCIAKRDA